MKKRNLISSLILGAMMLFSANALQAQVSIGGNEEYDIDYLTPKQYEIGGITLENAEHFDSRMILLVSGLQVGDKVNVPGDKFSVAIDNLWKQGMFEDVKILVNRIQGDKVFLTIRLQERPKMSKFSLLGVKKGDDQKIKDEMKISVGTPITENLLTTTSNKIKSFYIEKGYNNVQVTTDLEPDTSRGATDKMIINYRVKTGKKVKIDSLIIKGNTQIPTNELIKHLKNTHDVNYFKKFYVFTSGFWKRSKYKENDFTTDLHDLITYYNEKGYRDARIVRDTVINLSSNELNISDKKKSRQDRMRIEVEIYEGKPYYFRNITFAGNTVYSSETLLKQLRIPQGAPYNRTELESNLKFNPSGSDISSMYLDNGYLFFQAQPVEVAIENDSIDIEIRIYEGEQARIRNVTVEGNTLTNDKVILRELHTRPGDLFSREALMRSYRELMTLGYFKQEKIQPDTKPNPNDGTVDIIYKVEEGNSSTVSLNGGYGAGMLIGTLGLQLNNFSTHNIFKKGSWAPLPMGDGQKLGINFTTTTGYYAGSISFTEPWLGGRRPQSLSVSIFDNYYSNGVFTDKSSSSFYSLSIIGGSVGLAKRLKWPDDYFTLSHTLLLKHHTLQNYPHLGNLFKDGVSNEIAYGISLNRNSFDSPYYTRSGSEISISGFVTPPYSLINGKDYSSAELTEKYKWLEYFKINIKGSWMFNVIGDVVVNARFRFGLMGSYNEDIGLSPFGRYYVGGDGLSGYMMDGREVIPLRGYKNNSLSPEGGSAVFDRYTLEIRQPVIENSNATIWGVAFLEGGNSWTSLKEFQPFKLYNSAGLGIRLHMPMIGMIGIDWGYGFDDKINGGSQFHFSIGQSID